MRDPGGVVVWQGQEAIGYNNLLTDWSAQVSRVSEELVELLMQHGTAVTEQICENFKLNHESALTLLPSYW